MRFTIGTSPLAVTAGAASLCGQLAAAIPAPNETAFAVLRSIDEFGFADADEIAAYAVTSVAVDVPNGVYRDRKTVADTLAGLGIVTAVQPAVTWAPNADGSLTQFAANTPRVTDLGLRIGTGTTNLVTSPDDLTVWTKNATATVTTAQLAPDGTNTAFRITDANAGGIASISRIITVATTTDTYVWTVYVKKEATGAATATIRVVFNGGTTRTYDVVFAPDTGTIISTTGNTVAAVEALKDSAGNDWWRISGTKAPPETHTGFTMSIYPASAAAANTGSITCWMPQMERAELASSPAVGTRAADSVTLALFDGADDDYITVETRAATKTGIVRGSLANANQVVLAPSGGDLAISGTVTKITAVTSAAQVGRSAAQLKALAANGGQPTTMTSGSPTFTAGADNAAATLTGAYAAWNTEGKFGLLSADWISAGSAFPEAGSGRPHNVSQTADGVTYFASDPFIEFDYTGDEFEIRLKGYGGNAHRMWVDGELSANAFPTITTGALVWVKTTFGSVATRRIRLEKTGGVMQVYGVQLKAGQSISAPPAYPLRAIILGDSYTYATGADNQATGFAPKLMHELGVADYRVSGSGGTGWSQENTVSTPNGVDYRDRWAIDMISPAPDLAIVVGSVNDDTSGQDPATCASRMLASVQELRAARPGCLIHIFGPQDRYAPSSPSANHLAITAAMQAALEGASMAGAWFHSMTGVAFEKWTDGAHPSQNGHNTLYQWMYGEIAAVHGLRAL